MSAGERKAFEAGKNYQRKEESKRKHSSNLISIFFGVDADFCKALDTYCLDHRVNRSSLIRTLIAECLIKEGYLKTAA